MAWRLFHDQESRRNNSTTDGVCSLGSLDFGAIQYFSDYHFDNRLRKGYVLENEWFWYFNILPYDQM